MWDIIYSESISLKGLRYLIIGEKEDIENSLEIIKKMSSSKKICETLLSFKTIHLNIEYISRYNLISRITVYRLSKSLRRINRYISFDNFMAVEFSCKKDKYINLNMSEKFIDRFIAENYPKFLCRN